MFELFDGGGGHGGLFVQSSDQEFLFKWIEEIYNIDDITQERDNWRKAAEKHQTSG